MRKSTHFVALAVVAGLAVVARNPVMATEDDALSYDQVDGLLKGLAYETKLISQPEKNSVGQFKVTKDGFDVYVTFEVSPSKRFIWLTTYAGKLRTDVTADQMKAVLKLNAQIQPAQAYLISNDGLKFAYALENRSMTPANLKWGIDKVVGATVENAALWQAMVEKPG